MYNSEWDSGKRVLASLSPPAPPFTKTNVYPAPTQTSFHDFQRRQVLCKEDRVRLLPWGFELRLWCLNTYVYYHDPAFHSKQSQHSQAWAKIVQPKAPRPQE